MILAELFRGEFTASRSAFVRAQTLSDGRALRVGRKYDLYAASWTTPIANIGDLATNAVFADFVATNNLYPYLALDATRPRSVTRHRVMPRGTSQEVVFANRTTEGGIVWRPADADYPEPTLTLVTPEPYDMVPVANDLGEHIVAAALPEFLDGLGARLARGVTIQG